ncbi:hypothetical protein L195_g063581, partial [Trifolium pratense]
VVVSPLRPRDGASIGLLAFGGFWSVSTDVHQPLPHGAVMGQSLLLLDRELGSSDNFLARI